MARGEMRQMLSKTKGIAAPILSTNQLERISTTPLQADIKHISLICRDTLTDASANSPWVFRQLLPWRIAYFPRLQIYIEPPQIPSALGPFQSRMISETPLLPPCCPTGNHAPSSRHYSRSNILLLRFNCVGLDGADHCTHDRGSLHARGNSPLAGDVKIDGGAISVLRKRDGAGQTRARLAVEKGLSNTSSHSRRGADTTTTTTVLSQHQ